MVDWLGGTQAGRLGHAAGSHSWATGVTTHLAEPAKEGTKYCVDKPKRSQPDKIVYFDQVTKALESTESMVQGYQDFLELSRHILND